MDKPLGNVVEVFSSEFQYICLRNLWECCIPNVEVCRVGVYTKSLKEMLWLVLFGNTYVKERSTQREPKTLLNAVRTMAAFPDGVCDSPFSMISCNNVFFVIPSASFQTHSKRGYKLIRMPCVWVFHPASRTNQWVHFAHAILSQCELRLPLVYRESAPSNGHFWNISSLLPAIMRCRKKPRKGKILVLSLNLELGYP